MNGFDQTLVYFFLICKEKNKQIKDVNFLRDLSPWWEVGPDEVADKNHQAAHAG